MGCYRLRIRFRIGGLLGSCVWEINEQVTNLDEIEYSSLILVSYSRVLYLWFLLQISFGSKSHT
jgi:hypothetical protein